MGVYNFKSLLAHAGHKTVVATYGDPPVNVTIECLTCNEVLLDYDDEEDYEEED